MTPPTVFPVREYEEIEVPSELISVSGELIAFPEVLERDYFTVRYRKGKLVFQAGGYLGVIPVNQQVSLEISAKVPVSNLERMLLMTQSDPYVLKRFSRSYNSHPSAPATIYGFLINSFVLAVSELHAAGFLKFYEERRGVGTAPKGRIDFKNTSLLRAKYSLPKVASYWAERHPDNAANQLLKYILVELLRGRFAPLDRKQRRSVSILLAHFDSITVDRARRFLDDPMVRHPDRLSSIKPHYREAVVLGKMLLKHEGVQVVGNTGPVRAASFLVDLDQVFEKYTLEVLRQLLSSSPEVAVLDGNKSGADGGARNLLDPGVHPTYAHTKIKATPDIVLKSSRYGAIRTIVVEVKYKSIKDIVDRADLNQVITYAASYGASHAILLLPTPAGQRPGLRNLGMIGGAHIFQYLIDLGASNIEQQEQSLRTCILELFNNWD